MLLGELLAGNSQQNPNSSLSTVSGSDDESQAQTESSQQTQPTKLGEMFNICSTQSTGKPGCIMHLTRLVDSCLVSQFERLFSQQKSFKGPDEILLMHTFDEALALSDYEQPSSSPVEHQKGSSGKFFSLLVQRSLNRTVIKMWSLKISTQTPLSISEQEMSGSFKARSYSLAGPQFYASALPIVATAARLVVGSKKIYEAPIDFLPDDVEVRALE